MAKAIPGPIELGDLVKDKVTALEGIAVAEVFFIDGCHRFEVQPQGLTKDGELKAAYSFDQQRLLIVKKQVQSKPNMAKPTGGPHKTPASF